ncbi:MAG: nucleotidyl transferase AbiEii/AbiGii toxin family protein [Bacteroidales bacterium]|jgi:predicted nucleotidyltransferase component of viral defense system|nr:nucleotidyl transferase AbiEii/AbiGii toxin family protein [Bacteroidales bacterium]
MEHSINLHNDNKAFQNAIQAASQSLSILPVFIEKDYWITQMLKRLSESTYANAVVFKGGTSLSKAYKLINRFSEDIDIAVIHTSEISGNMLKNLIRTIEKEIAQDLEEFVIDGITSKGSRFRKSVFKYPENQKYKVGQTDSNFIIVEVNTFANPYPYLKASIQSLIGEYLQNNKQNDLIKRYGLEAFELNVLDKNRTLIEKLASLIRFSFDTNPIESISGKIRHFYDLYYLLNDSGCNKYVNTDIFLTDLQEVIEHDKKMFDDPKGWKNKQVCDSPLLKDFDNLWNKLKKVYTKELSMLAFTEIPNEIAIANNFKKLISIINKLHKK